MKKINKYKFIFLISTVLLSLLISIFLYKSQNFTEYTKFRISYSLFEFESHSNFKKIYRDLDNYNLWKNEYSKSIDISDFIPEGTYNESEGFKLNQKVRFPNIRETQSTYDIIFVKTSNEKILQIYDYLNFCKLKVEKFYIKKYPSYIISISLPLPYFRENFRPLIFYIIMGILGGLFFGSMILYFYEEIKSLKLIK